MSTLPKTTIVITRCSNTASEGEDITESTTTIFTGDRRVVVVPISKLYEIYGADAVKLGVKYLVYLELGDAFVKNGDIITFYLGGFTQVVKVKHIEPMTKVINNRNRELWCTSNNN